LVKFHQNNFGVFLWDTAATNDVFYMQKVATTETKTHGGGMPITVDEYSDLKQSLKVSEMQMQQLLQSNTRLGEEVGLLQNMASRCSTFQ